MADNKMHMLEDIEFIPKGGKLPKVICKMKPYEGLQYTNIWEKVTCEVCNQKNQEKSAARK